MEKKKEDSKILKARVKFFDKHYDLIAFIIIIFMAISVYMIASAGMKEYKVKYVCTQSIEAVCTNVSSLYDEDDGMKYYPTFTAIYQGKTYHYKFKFPSSEEPRIGDSSYFYINPKDPTEYIDSTNMQGYGEIGVILFGCCIFGIWLNRWITKKEKNNES